MDKKNLASILIARNNDYFRVTTDKNSNNYIHDTSINCARKIVMQIASNILRSNHVNLIASPQSGKTSVCNSVVNIINKANLHKNMAIKKYMFISGMNDCGLKEQTYKRVIEQIADANVDNTYFGKRCKRNLSENKYFVLKNSDLMSFDGILDNTLIFIDESHYGSNEKNILTKFLVKNGIDWKDTNELIRRNIYIVSVSATPFDELVSDTANCKKGIELDHDDDYYGVSDFINNELVFEATKDDIKDGTIFDYIEDSYYRMNDNEEDGVIIIRTRDFDIIKENQFVETNFNIFEMYASGSKIEYDKLDIEFERLIENNRMSKFYEMNGIKRNDKPLIVLIKGAFRAGITIKERYKDLIYMVYDYSLKCDTTAQALLGRMCGYRSNDENFKKTHFYVNYGLANMYSNWENDLQNRDIIPCDKQNLEWVDNGYQGNDVMFCSRSCGNFAIPLSDDIIKVLYKKCKGKRNRIGLIEDNIKNIFATNNYHLDYDYIGEVHMSGKNNYAKSSQDKRFNSFDKDLMVFPFRADKIKKFVEDTNRNYLTKEDVGKKCISLVLDANINENGSDIIVSGNKRLLVYHVEVGQKKLLFSRKNQYKPHKDTSLI